MGDDYYKLLEEDMDAGVFPDFRGDSDCCGGKVNMADSNGHGFCSICHEHCTTRKEEDNDSN